MMTEQQWKQAWGMFCAGRSLKDIERHFGAGHTTIACGFQRRGWYDRATKTIMVRNMPAETPTVVKTAQKGRWSPKQVFVAEFLAERRRPLEHIAAVVNQPVEAVKDLLAA